MNIFRDIIKSYTSMPLLVQLWIGLILIPVNCLFIFFMPHPLAIAQCSASLFVLAINGYIIYKNHGLSKVLAIPHLIAWFPLCVYAAYFLFCIEVSEMSASFTFFAWAVLIINAISLAFDVVDTIEWKKGNRAVSGFEDQKPWL